MTHVELTQALTAAELYPIPVEGDIDYAGARGLLFRGDLAGFIQAAKALTARCVFVASRTLEESDFCYQPAPPAPGAGGGPDVQPGPATDVDLCAVEPALQELKAHMGQECGFRLSVQVPNATLGYVLHLPWWQRLCELRERAVEKVRQERDLARAEQREQEERRSQLVLDALRQLLHDPDFVRLPTQRAMQTYALEHIEGLDTIPPATLKLEIQSLDATIKARGLGRKR